MRKERRSSKPDEDDMKDALRAHVCVCVCVCERERDCGIYFTCAKDCSDLPRQISEHVSFRDFEY